MNDLNIAERLKNMDEAWDGTEASGANEPVPDGTYQATVNRFDFHESKKDGSLLLRTELTIQSGDHAGRTTSTFHDLENEERLGWTKGHLDLLGLEELSPLSTLENRLHEVLDTPVEIQVKTTTKQVNGEARSYSNTYVNKRLGPPASGNGVGTKTDDDIPF